MTTTKDMLNKFKRLNLQKIAADTIKQTKDAYVQYNKDQLYTGGGADGNRLPAYRSKAYAAMKAQQNSLPGLGIPDYYLTGRMYSKMQLQISKDTVKVISKVEYYEDLANRGGDPFGLSPDSKQDYYYKWFRPIFIRAIADKTGTKLG